MSEEMKDAIETNETPGAAETAETSEAAQSEPAETMADYEDHFDDANPWNRVTEYMEKRPFSPSK